MSDEFIMRVLNITAENDSCDDIWWRTDSEYAPVTFFVNCNDLFFWACADCEALTPDNIDLMEKTYADAKDICKHGECYAAELFCCRARKMRPQQPYYKHLPKAMYEAFNTCGPERDV